jgi:hypothetical protein
MIRETLTWHDAATHQPDTVRNVLVRGEQGGVWRAYFFEGEWHDLHKCQPLDESITILRWAEMPTGAAGHHLTAQDILSAYQAVYKLFTRPSAWFAMLHIAAAGAEGLTARQLSRKIGCAGPKPPNRTTLLKWEAAGLITITVEPCHGPKAEVLRIQQKALHLLRLTA